LCGCFALSNAYDPKTDLLQYYSYCPRGELDPGGLLSRAEGAAIIEGPGLERLPRTRLGGVFTTRQHENRTITLIPEIALIIIELSYFGRSARDAFKKIIAEDGL
jgi:hypothetical protein